MKRSNIFWLAVGVIILVIFLFWYAQDIKGFEIPKTPSLFFLASNSVLWIIQEDSIQTETLTAIDQKYLFDQFKRPSSWKIAGDYMGIAGGSIITAGQIASFLFPPLSPIIQIGTKCLGGGLALLGGIFRFTAKDLTPQLFPAQLHLVLYNQKKLSVNSLPEFVLIARVPYHIGQSGEKIITGYLLGYSKERLIGGLNPKRIKLAEKDVEIEVVVNSMGVWLPGKTFEYASLVIIEK
jgi:hypothetical protein